MRGVPVTTGATQPGSTPDPQPNGSGGDVQARFLVICRATDNDPEGCHAEARIGYVQPRTPDEIADLEVAIAAMYRAGFDEDPVRVAVVELPWVEEVDGE